LYDSVTEEEDDEGRDATFSPGDDSQSKPQRRTTTPRQAKRGRDTASDSSSKAKSKRASSPPKKRAKSGNGKKSRPGQERKQTALARKSYGSLSDSEEWIVEVPGQGILSWRHRGILMKFPPGTANAVTKAFGFPDYAPNLAKDEDVQALRERWDPVAFKELMDTRPWDVMFEDRSKFLILLWRSGIRENLVIAVPVTTCARTPTNEGGPPMIRDLVVSCSPCVPDGGRVTLSWVTRSMYIRDG
ncbi:hypothetical protein PHMEG_00037206, partial [Phytophthora megakarya]